MAACSRLVYIDLVRFWCSVRVSLTFSFLFLTTITAISRNLSTIELYIPHTESLIANYNHFTLFSFFSIFSPPITTSLLHLTILPTFLPPQLATLVQQLKVNIKVSTSGSWGVQIKNKPLFIYLTGRLLKVVCSCEKPCALLSHWGTYFRIKSQGLPGFDLELCYFPLQLPVAVPGCAYYKPAKWKGDS